jgi:hypothetical protein
MSAVLEFVRRFVAENGGDFELDPDEDTLHLLLPEPVRERLGLPSTLISVADASDSEGDGPDITPVGYGAPLLDRIIALAREQGRTAAVRMPDPPSRKSVGDLVDRHLTFPNATYRVMGEQESRGDYWLWAFDVTAEADERVEKTMHICISSKGADGDDLPALILARADEWSPLTLSGDVIDNLDRRHAAAMDRAILHVDGVFTDFYRAVERHHERDARRIASYFEALRGEMEQEIERRRLKGEERQIRRDKQKQLTQEEAAKLAGLREKYRVRLSIEPRSLLIARIPVTRCDLLVKRRKGERRLSAIYNLLGKRFDVLVCEACGADTMRPGFCDSALHLLCEACLSKSGGRGMPDCPACNGQSPPVTADQVFARRGVRRHPLTARETS